MAAGCSLQDIEVRQSNWHMERDNDIRVVGEIYNGCADAIGVELQAVFRDKAGQVMIVDEFWPARRRNIAAKDTYAFETIEIEDSIQAVSTLSIKVIDLKRW